MRVLILGGSGMLGHKLWQTFADRFDTYITLRQATRSYAQNKLFDSSRVKEHVSVCDFDSIVRAIGAVQPAVVVNCIGVVKQDAAAKDPFTSISVNALFPHRLAHLCQAAGIRLIHISTDCVFSGCKGNYQESDVPDAEDLYGRTKLLGEVSYDNSLTLRTSMIGRELVGSHGLIEWFLSQEGKTIRGYTQAIFSGFTTNALAKIIAQIIIEHQSIHGVWHVASEAISKFELLSLIKQSYQLNIGIEHDETFVCDRTLNANKFRQATSFVPPAWADMIEQMHQDTTAYAELRRIYAR